ncbi:MAG: gamma-glutamyltransferase [Acidobacteria bacterium]|nr:gamma-glutamyltransferase [Acidobacteriota bacterium]
MKRRRLLRIAGGATASLLRPATSGLAAPVDAGSGPRGSIAAARAPLPVRMGYEMLRKGGNAIDAAVAAALTAAIVEPSSCGVGGYGTHITIARADGKVTCIDGNSMAPQAARADMFETDDEGQVPGKVNYYGWLSAGIPGTLGGLQLALDRYGTKKFGDVAEAAIRLARDGVVVSKQMAASFRGSADHFRQDPASKKLYFDGDGPLAEGATYRNPDVAALLEKLAERGTSDSFYRGDIGRHIAAEFQKHGGIATADDFAAYHAKEVEPVELSWRGYSMHTAPITAGGASTLQALAILKELKWEDWKDTARKNHAALEALRLTWADRFQYFGDMDHVDVPLDRLLSDGYVRELAARVDAAVKTGKAIKQDFDSYEQRGTIHISTADRAGNLVALTLTHGGGFGARVTVEGLGVTLGHGVSRFDPRPGRANSIGPRKRPLNNMTPTAVLRDGRPVLALGARGGRRIPNAVYSVLLKFVGEDRSMAESVTAPRMHTIGNMAVALDDAWNEGETQVFKDLGFEISRGSVALLSATSFDPGTGKTGAVER